MSDKLFHASKSFSEYLEIDLDVLRLLRENLEESDVLESKEFLEEHGDSSTIGISITALLAFSGSTRGVFRSNANVLVSDAKEYREVGIVNIKSSSWR